MKKWSLLVATLLLMGATATTFTSCVDTDEPEGILNMRNAKAEYIRALAAVENAKIAYQQAAAQSEAANAELAKAQAEAAKAQAEIAKAQAQATIIAAETSAKIAELEAQGKNEIAKAEAAKLMAEAEQAKAECQQTIAQNEIILKEMQAKLDVVLQETQTKMVYAQAQYELAKKDLAALELVASDVEKQLVANARTAYETAFGVLAAKSAAVTAAQKALYNKIYGNEDDTESLAHQLADKNAELVTLKAVYAELQKLAADLTPTAWEARRDSLAKYIGSGTLVGDNAQEKAELQLKLEEIKQSAEYKAADAKDKADLKAYIQAQQYYNYLANKAALDCKAEYNPTASSYGKMDDGSTHDAAAFQEVGAAKSDYKVSKVEDIKIDNKKVEEKFNAAVAAGYATAGGKLKVAEQKNLTFDKISGDEIKNLDASKAIKAWEEAAAKVKVTAEEAAADTCQNADAKALADAQKAHKEAVEKWQKMHKTYEAQAVEKSVSTDAFKASIKKYNDNIDALEAAVKAYNTAYDEAVLANAKAILDGVKGNVGLGKAKAKLNAISSTLFPTSETDTRTTKAMLDAYITSKETEIVSKAIAGYETLAKVQAAANTAYNNGYNDTYTVAEAEKVEKWAQSKAVAGITAAEKGNDFASEVDITKTVIVGAEVKPVADAKTVVDAKAKITSTDPAKPGVVEALKKAETDAKKLDNGSYQAIGDAVTAFVKAAGDNCEKLKKAEDSNDAAIAKYTGVGTKIFVAGQAVTATEGSLEITASNWVLPAVVKGKTAYEGNGHLQVVRTKVSDENVAKMATVEFDSPKATTNWKNASKDAFGATDGRHTEVTSTSTKAGKTYDQEGNEITNYVAANTLAAQVAAQKKMDDHAALAGVAADAQKLVDAIAAAKTALTNELAELAKPVTAAQEAIAPAKAAHQASHNAAAKLTADVNAQLGAIANKVTDFGKIKNAIQDILNAYYNNQTISYTDENGTEQKVSWTSANRDFAQVEKWIKEQLKKYDTKAGVATSAVIPGDDHGKIANKEAEIAEIEKIISRLDANDYESAAHDYIVKDLEYALELAQKEYDYYLAKFNRAEEALNKVLEAVGNGTAANYTPSGVGTSGATNNGGEYYGGVGANTNTTINVDL